MESTLGGHLTWKLRQQVQIVSRLQSCRGDSANVVGNRYNWIECECARIVPVGGWTLRRQPLHEVVSDDVT